MITAGTAIRESATLLSDHGAYLAGIVVCLDRQEKVSEDVHESAIQVITISITITSKEVKGTFLIDS